jgi:hypothetical protein
MTARLSPAEAPERVTLHFRAPSVDDAQRQAREWARAEPGVTLRTICSVHREPEDEYLVEVAVRREMPS